MIKIPSTVSLMAAAVASSVSSSETGVAADVELELSPPLDEAIVERGGVDIIPLTHDFHRYFI